jgi:transcriptional antiterminator
MIRDYIDGVRVPMSERNKRNLFWRMKQTDMYTKDKAYATARVVEEAMDWFIKEFDIPDVNEPSVNLIAVLDEKHYQQLYDYASKKGFINIVLTMYFRQLKMAKNEEVEDEKVSIGSNVRPADNSVNTV